MSNEKRSKRFRSFPWVRLIISILSAYPLAAIEYCAFSAFQMSQNPVEKNYAVIWTIFWTPFYVIETIRNLGYLPIDEGGGIGESIYYLIIPTTILLFLIFTGIQRTFRSRIKGKSR